jgi:uncharacterized protein (DUF433 family)
VCSSMSPVSADRRAFTTEQVLRVTGVSRRKLAYWLDREIISADIDVARGRGHVRLWSFRNLVEIKVALWLRERVSLQLIGRIVATLRTEGYVEPLAEVRYAVVDTGSARRPTEVVVQHADGSWVLPVGGQIVFEGVLPLAQFADELERSAGNEARIRRTVGAIEQRRGALGSAAVLAGTRIPVKTITRLRAAGWDEERILENYPDLTTADIRAALDPERAG